MPGAPYPYGITVTLYKQIGMNRYGDYEYSTDGVDIKGCAFSYTFSSFREMERSGFEGERDILHRRGILYAPKTAEIDASDVIALPTGERWQVDGAPNIPVSPFTGWSPGMEVNLLRVTG